MMPSPAPPEHAGGFARGYAAPVGLRDELLDEQGHVRPHWQQLLAGLDGLGRAEVDRRWARARDLIHQNGVSYNVYGDPQGMERPWSLSPMPVLLPGDEWSALARAIAQRARLLSALLADLYGPQRTLGEGLLPPELVFGSPRFLRACHGLPLGRWLPFYGVDVVRTADGRFVALADRTQAPSGAGYALENRIVVARALPDLFRSCNVERLALFFRTLQETMGTLAPQAKDNPRVVLLTPGPFHATYFEQAYLAQYLGYTLVTGADLTVRDDRVCLKTLGGLQPVDVVLRRVNDDFCDPLELRPDSLLGVPGLVHAVRQNRVAIVNPLGTGLLQTTALLPYLPRLARALLGEELALSSVRTWWCGDPAARQEALARFPELVWKRTVPDGRTHPTFAPALDAAARDELAARVRAEPQAWVAQELAAASTTPALTDAGLAPRALVLRSYAVAAPRDPDGWHVMPGALARVAAASGSLEVTMQAGAGSHDAWVLSDGPVSPFTLLPSPTHTVELQRGVHDLPSRVADNLYWMGRYAERADAIARLARVTAGRLQGAGALADLDAHSELDALLGALAAQTDLAYAAEVDVGSALANAERWLVTAVIDGDRPGSLVGVTRSALRAARVVRDRLSGDTWHALASMDEHIRRLVDESPSDVLAALAQGLDDVVLALAAFQGLAMESMTRGHGWRFLDLGRRLERALTMVGVLRGTFVTTSAREASLIEALLDVADSGMTYRRRYQANLQAGPALDLLLTDETNPRSVLFQLQTIVAHVEALPHAEAAAARSPQLRTAIAALTELQLADVDELVHVDAAGSRPALTERLDRLTRLLPALSESLSSGYLSHAATSKQLRGGDRA